MSGKRRVVVTGLGALCSIGRTVPEILEGLMNGLNGISFDPDFEKHGFACQVSGRIVDYDPQEGIDREVKRFMGKGRVIALGYQAALQAVADSGLTAEQLQSNRTSAILGTGGPSTVDQRRADKIIVDKGSPKSIGPFGVYPCMSSGLNAVVTTAFKIRGGGFNISSACATSAHAIGEGYRRIMDGYRDIMIVGGAEDCDLSKAHGFDAMGALVRTYNDRPAEASRPFDAKRNGFVDAEGAAVLVLEEHEQAIARGAHIYAEILGYGDTSDGADFVAPSGEGALRCMLEAREEAETRHGPLRIDYINPHATSTPKGDMPELEAIANFFGVYPQKKQVLLSATKSQMGHLLGGAGAIEAVASILMLKHCFVSPTLNLSEPDPEIPHVFGDSGAIRIVRDEALVVERDDMQVAMSNSFGFGGTNATLIFRAWPQG